MLHFHPQIDEGHGRWHTKFRSSLNVENFRSLVLNGVALVVIRRSVELVFLEADFIDEVGADQAQEQQQ